MIMIQLLLLSFVTSKETVCFSDHCNNRTTTRTFVEIQWFCSVVDLVGISLRMLTLDAVKSR